MFCRGAFELLARFAACLAFAICSRSVCDEFALGGACWEDGRLSALGVALAFETWPRSALEELGTLLLVAGVFLTVKSLWVGEGVVAATLPGGEMAWPNTPLTEVRSFGVFEIMVLLLESGLGCGVSCRLCIWESGCFFTVEFKRPTDGVLAGVAVGVVAVVALALRLPGAVMDILEVDGRSLRGVIKLDCEDPSLVVGREPLLDIGEAGLMGGGMELSALKKLDLRLPLAGAGDGGMWARLSTVLSEREGRDFLDVGGAMGRVSSSLSSTFPPDSASRKLACELARDEALETERNPPSSPSTSSWRC